MNRPKRTFVICCGLLIGMVVAFTNDAFAYNARKDYFYKPQLGAWFGPISPVAETGKNLKTTLGGGLFFRYNIPWQYFKVGLDLSYQNYDSIGVNDLMMVPIIANGVFLLPIPIAVRFQLKTGFGTTYMYSRPDRTKQWDPIFMAGFEISFPAGRIVNIGLRIDYQLVIESTLPGAERNGHFINTGIQLYFNI